MAVDNLPSELPRDSSTEFSYGVINEVLPYIIENDDGSLSWYALKKNVRFINIETRLGYLTTQSKMLKYVNENLF